MAFFLYRRGDGNEGNYPRAMVILQSTDNVCAALRALVANDWQAESATRIFICENLDASSDGNEYGAQGHVHEGPHGETAFEAGWLTCELEPYTDDEAARHRMTAHPIREILDASALAQFNLENAA